MPPITRQPDTIVFIWRVCSSSDAAAAAACSTSAAFCCVTESIWPTARLTCSMPVDCSSDAALISPMMSVTRRTACTISSIVEPARDTSADPLSTFSAESPISVLISFAALALRCASERTSPATTAKPRPCSPARAASTAAFSARMLVWNAMPSIVPMMSTTLPELAAMSCIVDTTWPTTSPPCVAMSDAFTASWLACRAFSAFCRTVPVSCSMLDAVSCSDAACSSVRCDRSMLPVAISRAPTSIDSVPRCTACTIVVTASCIRLMPPNRRPISFVLNTLTGCVRSPPAMRSKCAIASSSGCTISPRSAKRIAITTTNAIAMPAAISPIISEICDCVAAWRSSARFCSDAITADAAWSYATNIGLILVSATAWYAAMSPARAAANSGSTPSFTIVV
ncbi:hypothetical protein BLA6863_08017 [Burkholderia lata]|uniref:Uncharacterized protein n=1 Tax=Burkholderia lata (strain ATCC 17760 / DSM 23089 / LMG 22485 / NCIMB 9086 / R18194 / 383) TaxID=482957 RepID=A0A6P2T2U5_BURL3|nr:hypothetical protein BLA6863_08017 [Burkholderia lata]